jgi:hypothetical protein
MTGWLFANDPFLTLEYEGALTEVKKALTSRYFEEIIERYLGEPHLDPDDPPRRPDFNINQPKNWPKLSFYRSTIPITN